ncbi:MAG TPA: cytochrome C oxidase subunit I [Paraburkholderia sp.]|nr:cytochrome C oxidase subunit I [Paraburkholderia sp.]
MQSPQSAAGADARRAGAHASDAARRRGRRILLLLVLICAAPIAISYFMYYVVKPKGGTTSYGTLIEPQRPIPGSLQVTGDDGQTVPLASLRGRWLMLSADGGACGDACVQKLYFMRQVRATQGPERDRVVTVWLRTDAAPVPAVVRRAYPDTRMLRADPAALAAWLPATGATSIGDHIYVVDPNGNLMMRFPAQPDPSKIKSDVTKLLKWSSIG